MGIDNQFLIGTLLFAGLGYYLVSQKTPDDAKKEKEKQEAREIMREFDDLKDRLAKFKSNDSRKGRNKGKTPLSQDESRGLVEVITRLGELDKRQSRTQVLDREHALRLHEDVSDLDGKARHYLDRYDRFKKGKKTDVRNVDKQNTRAAIVRGMRSHSRTIEFVADSPVEQPSKKRKANFVQNAKPSEVFAEPEQTDNTVANDRSRSAFETNEPNDTTMVHADGNADDEEETASGAHGKQGQAIRPLDQPEASHSSSNNVQFNQAPGPVPDNADRVQRVEPPRIRRTSESAVWDLSGEVSKDADEQMEVDLIENMEALENESKHLTKRLETKLTAIIAKIYFDDPDEGDAQMKQLRVYRARDMGLDIIASIGNPQDPVPRRRKRPVTQVIAVVEASMEESAMAKRLKTQKAPVPREEQVTRQMVRKIGGL